MTEMLLLKSEGRGVAHVQQTPGVQLKLYATVLHIVLTAPPAFVVYASC